MMDKSARRAAAAEKTRRWRAELKARETPEEAVIRRAKAAAQRRRLRESKRTQKSSEKRKYVRYNQSRHRPEITESLEEEEAILQRAKAAANKTFKFSCQEAVSIDEEGPEILEFPPGESPSCIRWKNQIYRKEEEKDGVEVLVYIDEADVSINPSVLGAIENDISSVPKMAASTRLQEAPSDSKFPPNHESQKTPTKDLKRPHRTSKTLSKIIDAAVMKEIALKEKYYKKKIKIAKRNAKARERIADALEKIARSS